MSTPVTILRPTVQLGMNSWLDFGLWRSRRVGSPTTVAEGYRRWPETNSALSRRKQGFESPRERQLNQRLSGSFDPAVGGFSNFSSIGSFPARILRMTHVLSSSRAVQI